MPKENGNKFKRKGRRKKRTAEYDEGLDQYAKVIDRAGSVYINVLPLGNSKDDCLKVRIPGKFRKRNWFNPDDFVVIRQVADNIVEIQGKVEDRDLSYVRGQFAKMDGNNLGGFTMGQVEDDDIFGDDDNGNNIAPQPKRDMPSDDDIPKNEDGEFDIDAI